MKNKKSSGSSEIIKRLFKFAKPYKMLFALSLVFAIINVCLTLYAPIIVGRGIDLIVEKGNVDFEGLKPVIVNFVIVVIITALSQWLMTLCTNRITYFTVRDVRQKAFDKLGNAKISFVDSHSHGDIISRIVTDTETIADGLLMGFNQLFTGVLTILVTLFFMARINIKITLIVVLLTPVSLFVARFIAKNTFNMFSLQSRTRGEMTSLIEEMINAQKVVKAFGYEKRAEERFDEINDRLEKCGVKALFFSALTNPCTRFVNNLVYAGVGVFGAVIAVGASITVGDLTCFLTYANQYTKPFNEISGVVTELQNAFVCAKRVFEIIDDTPTEQDTENAYPLENINGDVDIDNVYFSYTPEQKLIENLNLHVKSGEKVAIVGPTGCGKTTIINLLMRFYDVKSGEIKVSDENFRNYTLDSLRAGYGMVLQETWLKTASIKENIAYSNPDASMEEIIQAAKSAHAHSFIMRLEKGYDTIVSDDGMLSAGQKQLLCIARVMLRLPPMLILDEATSSIDTRTEQRIQRDFDKMMKGRTSFVVAHRLSTIKESDCILVMDKGRIIEQGNHEQLLAKGGFYANLYNSQFAPTK